MKELRDQSAHALALATLLLPIMLWPNPFTGAWAGFIAGMIREVTEEAPKVSLQSIKVALHSFRDLTCWAATGAIIGAFF